jgi:hypothetical protein
MATKKTRFIKGIILAPDSVNALDGIEGELRVDGSGKLQATLGTVSREVVTDSQSQTLTNKTLTSPVIDTGVSGTAIETDLAVSASSSKIASASAIKTYVDSQIGEKDQANEITTNPSIGGAVGESIQDVLEDHEDKIDDLITLSGVAANAESLGTFTGITIPDSSNVKGALQALETAHEEVDQNVDDLVTLSGVAENATDLGTFTGTIIPDSSKVKGALQSIETSLETKLAATGGIFTNGSIVTPVRLDAKQDTRANLETYALTATNGQIVFATDEKQLFQVVDGELVSIGGAGIIKILAGEDLAINDLVYISSGTGNDSGRTAGRVYKVDASNDDRVDVVGFVTKVVTAGNISEVQVSGLMKGFSGLTAGKLYYASVTPGSISLTPPSVNAQWIIAVALATSATEITINPVASAAAVYINDSEFSFSLVNNQTSAANVTSLLIDPIATSGFILDYKIYRQTDTAASGVAQIGQLRGVYNSQSSIWLMSDDFSGQDAGITLSIQPSGQIQYSSSDIAGANYVGTLKYNIRKTFGV